MYPTIQQLVTSITLSSKISNFENNPKNIENPKKNITKKYDKIQKL